MIYRSTSLVLALSLNFGCDLEAPDNAGVDQLETARASSEQSLEASSENILSYLRHGKLPPNCEVTAERTLDCEGEVLPNPDAPPEDWVPFEYNGEIYYFRPLVIDASELKFSAI